MWKKVLLSSFFITNCCIPLNLITFSQSQKNLSMKPTYEYSKNNIIEHQYFTNEMYAAIRLMKNYQGEITSSTHNVEIINLKEAFTKTITENNFTLKVFYVPVDDTKWCIKVATEQGQELSLTPKEILSFIKNNNDQVLLNDFFGKNEFYQYKDIIGIEAQKHDIWAATILQKRQ